MTGTSQHRLVGYSRKTDALVEEHVIPPSDFERIKQIAKIESDDPIAVHSHVLDREQAARVAEVVGVKIKFGLEYFVEAEAAGEDPQQPAAI